LPISTPRPVRAVALGSQARSTLLAAIVEGELAPDESLHESTLAGALGISRTPVREALHRLAEIDLVRPDSNRGYRVTPLEPQRLRYVLEVSAELAGMAARLALPHLTAHDMEWFESVQGHVLDFENPIPGTHPYGPHAVDLFVERCGNPVLGEAISAYRPHVLRMLRLFGGGITQAVLAERAVAVIGSLRLGDAHLFGLSFRAYYLAAGSALVDELEKSVPSAEPGAPS